MALTGSFVRNRTMKYGAGEQRARRAVWQRIPGILALRRARLPASVNQRTLSYICANRRRTILLSYAGIAILTLRWQNIEA